MEARRTELAKHVAGLRDWHCAFTVTFRDRYLSPHGAVGRLHQALADVGKLLHGVDYVAMLELHADGRPHFHGLMHSGRELSNPMRSAMRRILRSQCGHESILKLRHADDRLAAAFYTLKTFDEAPPEFLIVSRGLRRHRG